MNIKLPLAAGAALFASTLTAHAITVGGCSLGGVTINGYGDAVQCVGDIDGNDTGNSTFLGDLNAGSIFTGFGSGSIGDTWSLLGKSDEDPEVFADQGAVAGLWNAEGVDDTVVVTLKAGDFFSAFLFTDVTAGDVMGTFDLALSGITVGNGSTPALSHLSVWSVGSGDDGTGGTGGTGGPSPVPLPAAGLLLLTALGGAATMRRTKS